jgi:hypothetical protein
LRFPLLEDNFSGRGFSSSNVFVFEYSVDAVLRELSGLRAITSGGAKQHSSGADALALEPREIFDKNADDVAIETCLSMATA